MRILLNSDTQPGLLTAPPAELNEPKIIPVEMISENPPQPPTPPKNDENPGNANSGNSGLGEAIRKATAAITEPIKNIIKNPRGRMRKCRACDGKPGNPNCPECKGTGKLPNKAAVVEEITGEGLDDDETQIDLPPAGPTPSGGNQEGGNRFRRSVSSSIKSVFAILGAGLAAYADANEIDQDFTDKAIARAMPKPEDLDAFNDDLDAVLKKRNIHPENCEEWALGINAVKMALPMAALAIEFRRELRRKRKEGKK